MREGTERVGKVGGGRSTREILWRYDRCIWPGTCRKVSGVLFSRFFQYNSAGIWVRGACIPCFLSILVHAIHVVMIRLIRKCCKGDM